MFGKNKSEKNPPYSFIVFTNLLKGWFSVFFASLFIERGVLVFFVFFTPTTAPPLRTVIINGDSGCPIPSHLLAYPPRDKGEITLRASIFNDLRLYCIDSGRSDPYQGDSDLHAKPPTVAAPVRAWPTGRGGPAARLSLVCCRPSDGPT